MKAFSHILLLVLIIPVCFAQTNAPSQSETIRPLTNLSASAWGSIGAARAKKPLAVLTLTNDVTQDSVLGVVDRVNAGHGIAGYIDGYCGFGARLSRDYLGRGSLVVVSFEWDRRPKRTVIALYGTNMVITAAWRQDMTKALREKFGETFDEGNRGDNSRRRFSRDSGIWITPRHSTGCFNALRYLVATKSRSVVSRKLRGL